MQFRVGAGHTGKDEARDLGWEVGSHVLSVDLETGINQSSVNPACIMEASQNSEHQSSGELPHWQCSMHIVACGRRGMNASRPRGEGGNGSSASDASSDSTLRVVDLKNKTVILPAKK